MERRLAAIFAADVAGYSRLMSQDEAGTLRALAAAREIMDGLIAEHGGRIANTAGDSVLAEFPSAVDAVQCAVAVQERLAAATADVPDERRLRFRIGVHLGDVAVRGGDLLGDGVNIAARLEGLAEPGGVCLSEAVHGFVRKALPLTYTDLGDKHVKGFDEPVRAYAVRTTPTAAAAPSALQSKPLPLPDKPSIAVLPFTNMSGDPEQEYFADGVVEDITTALSRLKSLFVVARNSSFTYKGRNPDVRTVGRELGVRYVLEGSMRKGGQQVRITTQLRNAISGEHIWAERYDRQLSELFTLQDEITERVVTAIEPTITAAEIERAKRKPPESLGAHDFYLRALPHLYDLSQGTFQTAAHLLREAVRLDPGYADALAALAYCLGQSAISGWLDYHDARAEAGDLARAAILADPQHGGALASAAWVLALLNGQHEQATEVAERALRVHPNSALVRGQCGWVFLYSGQIERAAEQFEAGLRLNPLDPRARVLTVGLAAAHFFARRFDDAVRWCRRTLFESPDHSVARRYLAASLAYLGRREEAQGAIQELLTRQPNSCLSRSRSSSAFGPTWMLDIYVDGLKLAGLPE